MNQGDPHPSIHRMRAAGMSDPLIYKRLLLEGWSRDMLDPIFYARGMEIVDAHLPTAAAPTLVIFSSRASMLGVLFGACACAAVAFVFLYLRPPVVYSVEISQANTEAGTALLEYGALPALSNRDYYERVRKNLIEEKASFIDADLSTMRLTVYAKEDSVL